MTQAIFVGGLGESTLYEVDFPQGQVWIDPAVLMLGQVGKLRLAPNGTDPGPPDGIALRAVGAPGPYVGFPLLQWSAQMIVHGYTCSLFAWDWRKSVYPAGVELANAIRQTVTSDDPCALVGHSAGGLVCRAAWTELGLTGQQNLVRRIVTLGTPHWGSYAIIGFWAGSNPSVEIIKYWNQDVGYNTAGWAPEVTGYQYLTTDFYQRLGTTWPGLYDCLPVLNARDGIEDPNRDQLYSAANYSGPGRPQQAWLDFARDHTGPWLRSAPSIPPSNVLTCISGRGNSAPSALTDPGKLGTADAYGALLPGDGTVVRGSSRLDEATNYIYLLEHVDWFATLVANGDLTDLVLKEEPAPPPQPPVEEDAIHLPVLPAIPGALLPAITYSTPDACASGKCSC